MKVHITFSLLAASVLVSGCDTNRGGISSDFGNAVQSNMAVQIISPRVKDPSATAPDMSGNRGGLAIEKYEKGNVENLKIESTSAKKSVAK